MEHVWYIFERISVNVQLVLRVDHVKQVEQFFAIRSDENSFDLVLSITSNNDICNTTTCLHGDCSKDGKCICHPGWTSDHCNQSLIISTFDILSSYPMILFVLNNTIDEACH